MMGARAVIVGLCALAVAACEIRIASQRADDDVEPACGDFTVDPGEVCDDGNNSDGDGCSADCTSDESCGNGVVDVAMDETCDDGDLRGGDGCSADCKSDETCGNGVLDTAKGETCDDGNLVALDGCSANCQSNEECGNGQVDAVTSNGVPEQCDTGGASSSCDVDCTFAACGDGTVNMSANEECDDGNQNNGDQCDNLCRDVVCGNGTTEGNEQCDDGNGTTTDGCVQCKTAFCGDGFTRSGVEQCDDQNANVNDACTVNCQAAFCGDGFFRTGVEDCEDGNQNNGDGCDSNCRFEPIRHVISSTGQLGNMASQCDGLNENFYDGCNNLARTITWVDASPFQPSTVEITFNRGIDCASNSNAVSQYVIATDLNGVNFNDITITSDPQGCFCTPSEVLHTVTISGSGYVQGGTNTFTFQGNPIAVCAGLSFDPGLGGYAVVRTIR